MKGGYRGFYARNTITLTPSSVNNIHKRGGTVLGTSRGGHDTNKIVDSIQDRGINQVCIPFNLLGYVFLYDYMYFRFIYPSKFQVYIIGGDGTQRGASVIFEVSII